MSNLDILHAMKFISVIYSPFEGWRSGKIYLAFKIKGNFPLLVLKIPQNLLHIQKV